MPIPRTPMVDDDGSGTTGTIINNAWKQELYNQIDVLAGNSGLWAPYTVTWTGGTPAPAIGNGSLTGRFSQVGQTIFFSVALVIGSTTILSTGGAWVFGLPVAALGSTAGAFPAQFTEAGVRFWQGTGFLASNSSFRVGVAANVIQGTHPWTWKVGDSMYLDGWYERV